MKNISLLVILILIFTFLASCGGGKRPNIDIGVGNGGETFDENNETTDENGGSTGNGGSTENGKPDEGDNTENVGGEIIDGKGLTFRSNGDGTCCVMGPGSGMSTDLVIPNLAPNGDKVVTISECAFGGSNIESLSFESNSNIIDIEPLAFSECHSLVDITLPQTALHIGYDAFVNSAYYADPDNWEDGMLYISNHLVANDMISGVEYMIKEGTITVAEGALHNVIIPRFPASLQYIHPECVMPEIIPTLEIDEGNRSYKVIRGILYNYDGTELIRFCNEENGSNIYTIPDHVTAIGEMAFSYHSGLTEIIIPEGVERIGKSAFSSMDDLERVEIPKSLTYIGKRAFDLCLSLYDISFADGCKLKTIEEYAFYGLEKLEKIRIPEGVTVIKSYAFERCEALKRVSFEKGSKLKTICSEAFSYCKSLTNIEFPDGMTTIEGSAFRSCGSLTEIYVPSSVTGIGSFAFYDCDSLESITVPVFGDKSQGNLKFCSLFGSETKMVPQGLKKVTVTNMSEIDKYAFADLKNITSICLLGEVKTIGAHAFQNCTSLKELYLPEGLTTVGNDAFYSCKSIIEITIPASVRKIGSDAFAECRGLERVNISSVEDWLKISFESVTANPFYQGAGLYVKDCLLTHLDLPKTIENILPYAFYNYQFIESVNIPKECIVTSIGEGAFSSCEKLSTVNIDADCKLKSIDKDAFEFCHFLTAICLPESLKSIGEDAFFGCCRLVEVYNLSAMDIKKGDSSYGYVGECALGIETSREAESKLWTDSNGYIFYEDEETVYIVSYIGDEASLILPNRSNGKQYVINQYAFSYCESITDIEFAEDIVSIGKLAFYTCTSLKKLIITKSVSSIASEAFSKCASLANVYYCGSKSEWSEIRIGAYNEYLKNANIHYDYVIVPSHTHVFKDWVVILEPTCTTEGMKVGYCECGEREYINTLPAHSYGDWVIIKNATCTENGLRECYCECGAVYSQTIYAKHKYVNNVCSVCGDKRYSIGLEFTSNGDGTCYVSGIGTCTDSDIVIPPTSPGGETVTIIYEFAFKDCDQIISVVIPDSVIHIYRDVFYRCYNLESVVIGDGVVSIGNSAFWSCQSLISVEMGKNIRNIDSSAFSGCKSLPSIVIPDSVTTMGEFVFHSCKSLKSVVLSNNLTGISNDTFSLCESLTEIVIPDSVTAIGMRAFSYCKNLTTVVLGSGIVNVSKDVFGNCPSLTDVYYTGSEEQWNKINFFEGNDALINANIQYNFVIKE